MSKNFLVLLVGVFFAGIARAGVFGEPIAVSGPELGGSGGVELEGKVLFVGSGDSLAAYDVSAPLSPRLLSTLSGFDAVRQLRVQDGFVYVVSRETGMRIVDARDPKRMRIRSRFDSVEFATGVEVVGKVAFLSERINGVEAVDVSDPDHPAHIAIRPTSESQSCHYRDGYLYSGEWADGTVTVFDAHDMSAFRAIGKATLGGFGDGLEVRNGLLFCSTGHDAVHRGLKGESARGLGRGLDIFSLDDPARPRHLSRVEFPRLLSRERDFWTVRAANGFAFCADSHNGLFAVDARDAANAKIADRLCIAMPKRSEVPSACAASLAIGEGCLYVLFVPGSLYMVPVANLSPPKRDQGRAPKHSEFRNSYLTDGEKFHVYRPAAAGQARSIALEGDVAYVAFGDAGLHVLGLGVDGFTPLGELPGGHQVNDCLLFDGKLVTAEGQDGFAVYERCGATGFREVARRKDSGAGGSVAFWIARIDERYLALSGRSGGFGVYRFDDFTAPSPLLKFSGSCNWDRYHPDRAVDGKFPLFIPYGGFNWITFDCVESGRASAPRVPTSRRMKFSRAEVGQQRNGICVFGNRFLMTVDGGYRFVECDGSMGPIVTPPGMKPGIPRTDGRLVILTNRSGRFAQLWDFSNQSDGAKASDSLPTKLHEYTFSGNPDLAAFWRSRVIIPAGHQGVVLSRY